MCLFSCFYFLLVKFIFFVSLTRSRSNAYQGEPFEAVTTTGVDLFPHTPHYELFILFQR